MSSTHAANPIDETKLNAFIGQMLSDLGGASSVAMVRMGDALGLYKFLHLKGPMTTPELARTAKVDEQAMVFANEESPVYMMGGFDLMAALLENQAKVQAAFKSGGGVAWGDQAGCMFCAVARFFRPGYHNNLVASWLPALDGVVAKLERGAKVADVGCGHGWSTVLMAKAFPKSQFVGYDFHAGSIADAQAHANSHGVTRGGPRQGLPRHRLRPRDLLRLSPRHGRSGGCRRPHSPVAEEGRYLDARRADGWRCLAAEP